MREQDALYCLGASRAIHLLRGKRKIEILCILRTGPVRLGELTRLVPSASKKVLTENLRQLEEAGIVVRRDMSGNVRHIEYELTEGLQLATHSMLDELRSFGDTHQRRIAAMHVKKLP